MRALFLVGMLALAIAASSVLVAAEPEKVERLQQAKALRKFFKKTMGDDWIHSDNWNEGDPCEDEWYGVACEGGYVTKLVLPNNNLAGSIPMIMGTVKSLGVIDVSYNNMTGRITQGLGEIPRLYYLDVSNNNLKGDIPFALQDLKRPMVLLFHNNRLTGQIPPHLMKHKGLQYLSFSNNFISGPLPDNLGDLRALKGLWAENNMLDGTIPESINMMEDLAVLNLANNMLEGTIPSNCTGLGKLKALLLQNNDLDGALPASLARPRSPMRVLDVSQNRLSGAIPEDYGYMKDLHILRANDNWLSGTVPAGLSNAKELLALRLEFNRLEGALPQSLGHLKELVEVDVSNNQFVNPLPFATADPNTSLQLLRTSNNIGLDEVSMLKGDYDGMACMRDTGLGLMAPTCVEEDPGCNDLCSTFSCMYEHCEYFLDVMLGSRLWTINSTTLADVAAVPTGEDVRDVARFMTIGRRYAQRVGKGEIARYYFDTSGVVGSAELHISTEKDTVEVYASIEERPTAEEFHFKKYVTEGTGVLDGLENGKWHVLVVGANYMQPSQFTLIVKTDEPTPAANPAAAQAAAAEVRELRERVAVLEERVAGMAVLEERVAKLETLVTKLAAGGKVGHDEL